MDLETPPAPSEIEITVLGPGYGECIIIHLGAGRWCVIDSFLSHEEKPIAERYLGILGVDLTEVDLLLATHWDDDHIRGFATLVERCSSAKVYLSNAMQTNEFAAFVERAGEFGTEHISSGVEEVTRTVAAVEGRGEIGRLAKVDQLLRSAPIPTAQGDMELQIWALSPSHQDCHRFISTLGDLITASPSDAIIRKAVPYSKNDSSVVVLLSIGGTHVLLGGDLEVTGEAGTGWEGVTKAQALGTKRCELFKVAHHGSQNGHYPPLWANNLVPGVNAALAPWRLAGGGLPTSTDVNRILANTANAHITAMPGPGKMSPRGTVVAGELRRSGIEVSAAYKEIGLIRYRKDLAIENSSWSVEVFSPACTLDGYSRAMAA